MKMKRFSKELKLNKKTIAHLNSNEMKDVHGGIEDLKTKQIYIGSGCDCGSGTAPGVCC
ncbi:MAG: class I lanthipeptide [Candidatus Aminicenantes bacterium]